MLTYALRYLYEIARYGLIDKEQENVENIRNKQLSEKVEELRKNKDLEDSRSGVIIRDLEKDTLLAIKNDKRRLVFHRSIEDLATLFLSPLLAIAMYFILVQWEPTQANVYILAIVSFGTGLVTDEIVNLIIRTIQSVMDSTKTPERRHEGENVEMKKE
jgi:hypothetical protein